MKACEKVLGNNNIAVFTVERYQIQENGICYLKQNC